MEQDEDPHIQAWDGLETNYVGPALNVYSVTVDTKVPADKNDLVTGSEFSHLRLTTAFQVVFIEHVGPDTGDAYAYAMAK